MRVPLAPAIAHLAARDNADRRILYPISSLISKPFDLLLVSLHSSYVAQLLSFIRVFHNFA